MAGNRTEPKPGAVNRNTIGAARTVARTGDTLGPSLLAATHSTDWSPHVEQWWDTWRRSPQAILFEDTDWQRLALLAACVEQYWRTAGLEYLKEIRMVEAALGATIADRVQLRIVVTDDEAAESVETPQERRRRMRERAS